MLMHNHEIVCVSDAIFYFQFPLEKMIELVHVDVDQELAGKIAKRQADTRTIFSVETSDYLT